MRIIVGCKLVPEEQDITVKADGTLDTAKAAPKISQFDLNAIETTSEIKTLAGEGSIVALSVGGKELENTKARKDILSRGPDSLVAVMDGSFVNLLPHKTAKIMAAAALKTGFDLIVCGDGSGDLYAQQTGVRLGALLDVPSVSGISRIVSAAADKITAERKLENEVEVLEIPLPAVISVSGDINIPAIPGMKAILGAAKKPVEVLGLNDLETGDIPQLVELAAVKAPKQKERKRVVIEGDGEDKIAALIDHLRKIVI